MYYGILFNVVRLQGIMYDLLYYNWDFLYDLVRFQGFIFDLFMQLARFLYDVLFDYRVFLWHCTISGIPEKVRFVCLAWPFDELPAASVFDAIYNLGRNFAGFGNVETILNINQKFFLKIFCLINGISIWTCTITGINIR